MKKITLLLALLAGFSMHAQLFSDNFEDQDISDWTLLDEDGDGFNFKAYDPSIAQNGALNYLSSESYDPLQGALTPNNYAISPAIDVSGNGSLQLSYIVGGQDPSYFAENYTVYVSTGNTIADFMNSDTSVTVSFTENIGDDPAAAGELVPRTVDLSSLDGATTLYIAFRHHDVSDEFIINFDNVVLSGVLGISDNVFESFKYFYDKGTNVLTFESSKSAFSNIQVYSILGQEVINKGLSQTTETLNLSNLETGVYVVNVSIDGQTKSFKLLKQ